MSSREQMLTGRIAERKGENDFSTYFSVFKSNEDWSN